MESSKYPEDEVIQFDSKGQPLKPYSSFRWNSHLNEKTPPEPTSTKRGVANGWYIHFGWTVALNTPSFTVLHRSVPMKYLICAALMCLTWLPTGNRIPSPPASVLCVFQDSNRAVTCGIDRSSCFTKGFRMNEVRSPWGTSCDALVSEGCSLRWTS